MRCFRAANSVLFSKAPSSILPRTASLAAQGSTPARCPLTPVSHVASPGHAPWRPPIARPFFHTANRHGKSKGKGKNGSETTEEPPTTTAATTSDTATATTNGGNNKTPESDRLHPNPEDPFDFTDLANAFARAEKRFTDELKKLRAGGRFNADVIGAVPVQPDKRSPRTFALRELAAVVPLGGRRWSILAFEEASVKPILSAIQRSDEFNQQPQRSEDNPLELTMTVEPERADALAKRARDVCQAWRTRVRDEAHRRAEVHKKWRAEGVVLSDDFHRLKKELQRLQDERMKVILAKEKETVQLIMARAS